MKRGYPSSASKDRENLNRLIVVVIVTVIMIRDVFQVPRTLLRTLHRLAHSILTTILLLFLFYRKLRLRDFPKDTELTNTGTNFRESLSTLEPWNWGLFTGRGLY